MQSFLISLFVLIALNTCYGQRVISEDTPALPALPEKVTAIKAAEPLHHLIGERFDSVSNQLKMCDSTRVEWLNQIKSISTIYNYYPSSDSFQPWMRVTTTYSGDYYTDLIYETYDSGQWTDRNRRKYSYNSFDELDSMIYFSNNGNGLFRNYKFTYSYNSRNQIQTKLFSTASGDSLKRTTLIRYTYNEYHKPDSILNYYYVNDSADLRGFTIYHYGPDSLPKLSIDLRVENSGHLDTSEVRRYSFNSVGLADTIFYERENYLTEKIEPLHFYAYTYYSNGERAGRAQFSYLGFGGFYIPERWDSVGQRNANGYQYNFNSDEYNNLTDSWIPQSRHVTKTDSDGDMEFSSYEDRDNNGNWRITQKTTYFYGEPSGNPIIPSMRRIRVYPNPTSGHITVEQSDTDNFSLEIINRTGQRIAGPIEVNGNRIVISLSHLSSGIYFIRILNDQSQLLPLVIK